jgi:hypothetical protein
MEWLNLLSALASAATALGIIFAAAQLWLSRAQAVSQFEDGIAGEYRALAGRLPVAALLGEELSEAEYKAALDEFYHYFDLSNEQVFLRQRGRITRRTWVMWRDGIRSNLRRPAFSKSWEEIKARSNGDFSELRRLEADGFGSDPRRWVRREG